MGYAIITATSTGYVRTIAPLFATFEQAQSEAGHLPGNTFSCQPSEAAILRAMKAAERENSRFPDYSFAQCMT